jgi:hypothetical protein
MRPPTDYKILKEIRALYHDEHVAHVKGSAHHLKTYEPIDVATVAKRLGVDQESVFGRLYYHLDPKYGGPADEEPRKPFFALKVGPDRHCVNFPLLEAVLAGLWQERRRDLWALWAAAISLGIALGSLIVSGFALWS